MPTEPHCDLSVGNLGIGDLAVGELVAGADPTHSLDALFVNAPLRDYAQRPRVNDFTLPVLGMGYLAT